MPDSSLTIADLPDLVAVLSTEEQARWDRLFRVDAAVGELAPPAGMEPWIREHFGSVDAVRRQQIVKVTNLIMLEGALFNTTRSRRPFDSRETIDLDALVAASAGGPFCHPLEATPADVFGRVEGATCVTASNIAKCDTWHGLIIWNEHHPLRFTRDAVHDAVDTALAWAEQARDHDREARYFFFLWNCLWPSGASIIHGHAQMTLTRGMHYAHIERWRRTAAWYRLAHGVNYFDDLLAVHKSLGLAISVGEARIMPSLTPIKHQETVVLAPTLGPDLVDAVYDVLAAFVERLGVVAFNLGLYLPPWDAVPEDWTGFPAIVRIESRGEPGVRSSDLGAMELFASSVVTGDPFQVADAIRAHLGDR
ncbi:MAG: hypothetical protein KKA73_02290 [Chloroflexi bacterium]|nr:hypothetical protein [Chloroflexota bacterium]MBU1746496.1 hypothetical protein [Chloroflexota bacterium]MBU1878505.1 hypothetical protein [Chloroflexota bacterium]